MPKSNHFIGQPLYNHIIKLLDKSKILRISLQHGGERYIKRFDSWTHLVVMLYAVIKRFDSLREISASSQAEARKLYHLGILIMPSRSALSDANRRRYESILRLYIVIYTILITIIFYRTTIKKSSEAGYPTGSMDRIWHCRQAMTPRRRLKKSGRPSGTTTFCLSRVYLPYIPPC